MAESKTAQEVASAAELKAAALRQARRDSTTREFKDTFVPSSFSGDAFSIEDGQLLRFVDGLETDNIYTMAAVEVRGQVLDVSYDGRVKMFQRLFANLKPGVLALNIGCGHDVAIEVASAACNISVVHTDASSAVVRTFREKVGGRAFAANLADLDKILEEKSVDLAIGNSVMGYLSPRRIREVVTQLDRVIRHGAIFSFDLLPHSSWFDVFDGDRAGSVLNSSAVDPARLLEFVDRYGREQGPRAFWYYFGLRVLAVQLGLLKFLAALWSRLGYEVVVNRYVLDSAYASQQAVWVMRIHRHADAIAIGQQCSTEDSVDVHDIERSARGSRAWLPISFIDRRVGLKVATKLGIQTNLRQAPWRVIEFMSGIALEKQTHLLCSQPNGLKPKFKLGRA